MTSTKIFVKGVLCLYLAQSALAASAQIAKSGPGYLFRMKYRPGATVAYEMTASGQMQGKKFGMTTPMTTKILSVAGGVGTIKYVLGPFKVVSAGKSFNSKQTKTVTLKQNSRGNVVGGAPGQMPGGTIGLPANPVAVGESWKANTTVNTGTMPMTVAATYKFVGLEQMGRMRVAKIGVTMKGQGAAAVSGTGIMWLSVADGSMVKNTTSLNVSFQGNQMPMTMSIRRK